MSWRSKAAERPRRRHERGFTMVELLVSLAIVVTMAAVIAPVLVGAIDKARVKQGEETLLNLAAAIAAFEDNVKEHPGTLTQLWKPITTSDRNLCGTRYKSGTGKGGVDLWLGPYLVRETATSGLPIGLGVVQDRFVAVGSGTKPQALLLKVTKVSLEDAVALNERIDADADATAGTIRWSDANNDQVAELDYAIPYPRC